MDERKIIKGIKKILENLLELVGGVLATKIMLEMNEEDKHILSILLELEELGGLPEDLSPYLDFLTKFAVLMNKYGGSKLGVDLTELRDSAERFGIQLLDEKGRKMEREKE